MAKRPKARTKTATGKAASSQWRLPQPKAEPTAPVTEGARYRLTGKTDLNSLLRRCRSRSQQVQTIAGEIGEDIAKAAETKYLHRGAFAVTRKLDKMEPEKLAEFLVHFDHYLMEAGLRERAESVGELPISEVDDDGDGEAADEPAAEPGNVSRPKFGAGHPNFREDGDGKTDPVSDLAANAGASRQH